MRDKLCPFPNPVPTSKPEVVPVRPARPFNITPLCRLSGTSSNSVVISWAVEVGKGHTVCVYLVDQLTHQDMLQQLKAKDQRQPDYTPALIKKMLANADRHHCLQDPKPRPGLDQAPSSEPV